MGSFTDKLSEIEFVQVPPSCDPVSDAVPNVSIQVVQVTSLETLPPIFFEIEDEVPCIFGMYME
jgi:hypothetical protein